MEKKHSWRTDKNVPHNLSHSSKAAYILNCPKYCWTCFTM